jgi:hypothetical protein
MRRRSCTTNLLTFFEKITAAIDGGKAVDIIYLDFAKAFDTVPHARMKKKLRDHGIGGGLFHWIADWLSGRKQSGPQWPRVLLGGGALWSATRQRVGTTSVHNIYK